MSTIASTASGREGLEARAVAHVDLAAIEHNCALLKARLGQAALCAVVKADGYGHGAVESARAALAGGARWLAVVTATEAEQLRSVAIEGPLLVMGALTEGGLKRALAVGADVVVWRPDQADAASAIAAASGRRARLHVKHDSGMGRLGCADADQVRHLVERVAGDPRIELAGLMTHLATADERESDFYEAQLERFDPVARAVKSDHPGCVVHAANSAAVLRGREAHYDMARCGIAIYGLDPFNVDPFEHELRPALSLTSYVADVKRLAAGDSVGYGRTWTAERPTEIAVLPIGYGDGYRRGLSNRADVLIGGTRRRVVGTISMDNITVELGLGSGVERGDPAVLIGAGGDARIFTEELAAELGTINYEVTCGISQRVERLYGSGGTETR